MVNIYHRYMLLEEVAKLEGVQACRHILVTAFEKEQYHRYIAIKKPLLTEAYKQDCLTQALVHRDWPDWMWAQILWIDKVSFTTGGFGKVYIT